MRILVHIQTSTIPPNISARFPIFVPHFLPNSAHVYVRIPVIHPMKIAGYSIESVDILSEIPTASASILVASQSVMRDCIPNEFFSILRKGIFNLFPFVDQVSQRFVPLRNCPRLDILKRCRENCALDNNYKPLKRRSIASWKPKRRRLLI